MAPAAGAASFETAPAPDGDPPRRDPAPSSITRPAAATSVPEDFAIGARAGEKPGPARGGPATSPQPTPNHRWHARLKRGKAEPQARLDLHGMTLDQAHGALSRFLRRAAERDLRLVLVITGKGRERAEDGPIPGRSGVLRRQVPAWLAQPPLSGLVGHVGPAHRRHGGDGALYVRLKRRTG